MRRALTLAAHTIGLASPNPSVGCVLTQHDQSIGEGAHLYDQRDHAEIVALKQAAAHGHPTVGATAYVTLEPCSHHGRTGPCADALIAARIARCVVATQDPNPLVAGQGIARLRTAGVAVEVGLLQTEARTLNNPFACSITRHRPFVTLKAALSTDGMLAPNPAIRTTAEPHWLTGPESRAAVHRLRHASDAILTGIGTALADNPLLTDRSNLPRRRPLLRVLLDPHLRLPPGSNLLKTPGLHIFHLPTALPAQITALTHAGAYLLPTDSNPAGGLALPPILHFLHAQKCLSLLLETGSHLNAAFLDAGLADQAILFYAPTELGPTAVPFATGTPGPFALEQSFRTVAKGPSGADIRVTGLLQDPWPA